MRRKLPIKLSTGEDLTCNTNCTKVPVTFEDPWREELPYSSKHSLEIMVCIVHKVTKEREVGDMAEQLSAKQACSFRLPFILGTLYHSHLRKRLRVFCEC